jgi:hypothetical protein
MYLHHGDLSTDVPVVRNALALALGAEPVQYGVFLT